MGIPRSGNPLLLVVLVICTVSETRAQSSSPDAGCWSQVAQIPHDAVQFGHGVAEAPRNAIRPRNLKWELPIAAVFFFKQKTAYDLGLGIPAEPLFRSNCMFSCLQILEAFLWFVLITLLNVTLIILTLSVSRLLNLLLRLVAFLLFLNPQCLASISRWITASSSWKRFCLFVCRALSSIMVICMLTAIRLLLTFVMSLYLLLRS